MNYRKYYIICLLFIFVLNNSEAQRWKLTRYEYMLGIGTGFGQNDIVGVSEYTMENWFGLEEALAFRNMGLTGLNNTGEVADEFFLGQNYPNPFNPVTSFKFSIPKNGDVKLIVYDMLGNAVDVIWDGFMSSGLYNCSFDGTNLASGTYFYRLSTSDYSVTKKMVLVR